MIKRIIFCIAVIAFTSSCNPKTALHNASDDQEDPWKKAKEIEGSIQVPAFNTKEFNVLDYGVLEGEHINNSDAFSKAIAACHKAGGGQVVVPVGTYHTGTIHLLDNVNLHLNDGAEIRFSTDPNHFLPLVHTTFEGVELMNYSPLIYAYGKKNIAVTGNGILNGQANATNWWTWKGSKDYGWEEGMPNQNDDTDRIALLEMSKQGLAPKERVFGAGHHFRPSFIQFFDCQSILIKDVKIIEAPFWVIHPVKSRFITIDGVTVDSHGPNNDGCNPEYCKDVLIKNCTFNTGDDCIAIKSGRNEDGRRVAIKSERIYVKDCHMKDGHGGVVMGSEISAGVQDVYIENCTMDSPNLDRALRIKSNSKRGGTVQNIYARNINIGQVKEAVLKVNLFYATYKSQTGEYIPEAHNIHLENINVKNGGKYGVLAKGYKEAPISNITLKNVKIEKVDKAFSIENVSTITLIDTYINGALAKNPLTR